MNKFELIDLLTEGFNQLLFPIKGILELDRIPINIWTDSYLCGFLMTYIGEYVHSAKIQFQVSLDGDDFKKIIEKADPDNGDIFLMLLDQLTVSGDENFFKEEEMQKGREVAKTFLNLGLRDVFMILPEVDKDNENIKFAYSKAEEMKKLLINTYPDIKELSSISVDVAASQALIHSKFYGYIKDNKKILR
tara:strand:- start:89 stop:661 length:573 start_codon:yes stop_codon:yes gene_type:complete